VTGRSTSAASTSSTADPQPGPLDGIRVLDLSRFIAGPLCGQLLGDMGAEVIKVERPRGEDAREQGPRYKGESLYAMAFNRNKFGITLDTRHPAAAEILERLIRVSDVLVENYRPGTLETMGLGPSRLHELNPRLVVTSLSGFGQTGPLSGRALFDPIAQAMSGLMALSGDPDGPPVLTGTYIADHLAGLYGAIGTLLALYARQRTGAGQIVDVASLDAVFSSLGTRPLEIAMLGLIPQRRGSRDPYSSPANVFRASDGYLYIHGGTDPLFPKLCAIIGRPDLAADVRFRDVASRMLAADELEASVSAWTEARTIAEASRTLSDAGIPFGPVATVADAVASAQIVAREMLVEIDHPTMGPVVVTGLPIKLSGTPGAVRKAPPRVGEDNDRIFGTVLGLTAAEIAELRSSGVI
jgi:crotonobetainyl-CoA:carnitine CoA-transferase CaiB-like acyl-CoA transferase